MRADASVPRTIEVKRWPCGGYTLTELVLVIAVLAVVARIVIPNLSFHDSMRLAAAAEETGNALRYARSEAMRTGQPVLVDAETAPGRLLLWSRDCTTAGAAPGVIDPLTRVAYAVDIAAGPHTQGVQLTPRFLVASTAWAGLVFSAAGQASQACSVAARIARGTPEDGSGVVLSYAGKTVTIAIDPPTGRVTGF